ncbi:uncharacterized protein LOC116296943 [Actinia tenebrosa]|uniref:Uncharacterized protein LOC116296943 n=1 Tax=Actinia tenebrosa TaxID=6105 RepID=A0A6P8HX05_ACTTE|nr:uncharacterized protein LOC116296943 [Actinia tenebrosa]
MGMAYYSTKRKFGPKIQRWQEELNTEFSGRLLPTPLFIVETKTFYSRNFSNGQITGKKIKVRLQRRPLMNGFENIHVERFNAGSVGRNHVLHRCKWPECTKSRDLTNNTRESSYICQFHRRRMERYFTKMCADNSVVINGRYSPGDFEGYTALIELFQSAFLRTSADYQGRTERGKLLQDLFLNVRNFLIIVSTLIKPDEDLLSSFLPHIMGITSKIVKTHYQHSIVNLVSFMQHFVEYILFFFGIINPWDTSFPESKPYRQIGSGLGGMVGVLGLLAVSPPCALVAMGAGVWFGAVVGDTLYITKKRREMLDSSFCRYLMFRHTQKNCQGEDTPEDMTEDMIYLSGTEYGDTLLAIVLIVQALVILMAL